MRQTLGLFEPLLRDDYLLFDFGNRPSRMEAARDTLLAADFAFNAVPLVVLFTTERLHYQLLNTRGTARSGGSKSERSRLIYGML